MREKKTEGKKKIVNRHWPNTQLAQWLVAKLVNRNEYEYDMPMPHHAVTAF